MRAKEEFDHISLFLHVSEFVLETREKLRPVRSRESSLFRQPTACPARVNHHASLECRPVLNRDTHCPVGVSLESSDPHLSVQLDARSNGAFRQVLVEPSPVDYHRYRLLRPKLDRLPFRTMEATALDG